MEETESIVEKAKNFISKHKGKLLAAAALAGAGYYAYNHSNTDNNSTDIHSNKTTDNKTYVVNDTHHVKNTAAPDEMAAFYKKVRRDTKERWEAYEKILSA